MFDKIIESPDHTQERKVDTSDGLILGIYGQNDTEEIAVLKKMRSAYVEQANWFPDMPDRDDTDRYDVDGRTIHFASYESKDKPPIISMRLTPVDSFQDCLSWHMVENNPLMSKEVSDLIDEQGKKIIDKLEDAAESGELWDLTRLVNQVDERADVENLLAGLVEMIGAGIERTTSEKKASTENMVWVFTITPKVKAALDFLGIKHEVLTYGKISAHDNKDSYFCSARPIDALEHVKDNPQDLAFTLDHVEHGLRKANAL